METLVLDGKEFVKASKAAKELGYTSDYIGQLCRGGKISAHLVGRTWYVDKSELSVHKVEKKRISKAKARAQAKKSIEEHRIAKRTESEKQRDVNIIYQNDDTELIPTTHKLSVRGEEEIKHVTTDTTEMVTERGLHEHRAHKEAITGTVTVIDVADKSADADIVFLDASNVHKSDISAVQKVNRNAVAVSKKVPHKRQKGRSAQRGIVDVFIAQNSQEAEEVHVGVENDSGIQTPIAMRFPTLLVLAVIMLLFVGTATSQISTFSYVDQYSSHTSYAVSFYDLWQTGLEKIDILF